MERDCFSTDSMHVAVPRAAGINVHKIQVTATVRLCEPGRTDAAIATRVFGTDPPALRALSDWLGGHGVGPPRWRGPASTGSRLSGRWRRPASGPNCFTPSM